MTCLTRSRKRSRTDKPGGAEGGVPVSIGPACGATTGQRLERLVELRADGRGVGEPRVQVSQVDGDDADRRAVRPGRSARPRRYALAARRSASPSMAT
jgi:hypothetical protein